jgi:hypothetical protein
MNRPNRLGRIALAAVTAAGLSGVFGIAQAQPTDASLSNRAALIEQLKEQRELALKQEKEWSQEPLTQAQYDLQQKRIDRLISKLERGERVSPEEINEAMNVSAPYE